MSDQQTLAAFLLGSLYVGGIMYADQLLKQEQFSQTQMPLQMPLQYPTYPTNTQMYAGSQRVGNNNQYAGPDPSIPQSMSNVNLNTSGDQNLAYQLYQQGINAATPTLAQLNSISGNSQQQTGPTAEDLQGGVSSQFAPYNMLGGPKYYDSEYQAVNLGNPRAESISACAQNAPTFVATSLLPKPTVPGQDSWNISAPQNILANQNFLAATQQLGVDTVLGSNRNASHDIRNNIPNPISVVSPWMNTTILPDLERRPLDAYIPNTGLYSCGSEGCSASGSFVGQ